MTIEDPGAPAANNGEFWLFGYGYALLSGCTSYPHSGGAFKHFSDRVCLQEPDMEATTAFW